LKAVKIAGQEKVDTLVLFHHDPGRDDAAIDSILEQGAGIFRTHKRQKKTQ
jgi:hypothetical protein